MYVADEGQTLLDASRAIAARELSPVELLDGCLARIDAIEPAVRAFITLDEAAARADAQRLADELVASGPRSPLHGIPVGVKDLIDVAGLPTTAASAILSDNIAASDAPVVRRLRDAGAVIVGKTNTQEFAYGVVSAPTRNPWDVARIPGGSSGGSAAAVASGMVPGALGTDTAGSVRIPAALCGIVGLRPRRARIPLDGIVPLAPSLDACGPIAATVADCCLVWSVLTGDAPAPASAPGDLSVALPPSPGDLLDLDPDVERAAGDAAAALGAAGARLVEVDLPAFQEWDFPRAVLLMTEALVVHEDAGWYPDRADDYGDETVAALRFAERFSAATFVRSRDTLIGLQERWGRALDHADMLLLPTTPDPAPTVEEAAGRDDGHRPPVTRALTRICGPVNVCDLAAVTVTAGLSERGLPIGVQFIARDELTALAAAGCLESLVGPGIGLARRG